MRADEHGESPGDALLEESVSRRTLLKRSIMFGLSVPVGVSLLAACGDDDDEVQPTASGGSEATATGSIEESTNTPEEDSEPSDELPEEETGSGENSDGKKVTFSWGIDIVTFDPHGDATPVAFAVYRNVFSNLVTRDENLEHQPQVAASWEVIDDTTWEFNLREDVVFHDGSRLTSADIVYSFENLFDSIQASRVAVVDRVEAVDDYTVRIITRTPMPAFLTIIHYCWILPAETHAAMGSAEFSSKPVGSGPYRVTNWVKDDRVEMVRVEDHWENTASIVETEFRPIPESSTRVAALLNGEIDVAGLLPPSDIPLIEENPDCEVRLVRSLRQIFIAINATVEPFTDVRVRQALNYAVDIDEIIEFVLDGHGYPSGQLSGPAEFGYNPDLEPYPYDPDKARELLAEAGFPDGFDTVIETPIARYLQDVEVAQAIGGQLANVGINVEVRPSEYAALAERIRVGDMPAMWLIGWGATAIHADGVMGSRIDTERTGGLYYNNPEADELVHKAAAEFDQDKALEYYHELQALLHDDCPVIFCYSQEDIYGVRSGLKWEPMPNETMDVFRMSWE